MNDNYDMTSNQELAAWDEWKKICSVEACNETNRHYLRRRVIKSIRELLVRCKAIDDYDHTGRPGANGIIDDNDIVSNFDLFMAYKDGAPVDIGMDRLKPAETPTGTNGERKEYKQYKDFIWKKVADSNDPPMQVLNGKLLGPMGIVNDVCKWLITRNFMAQEETETKTGKKVKRFVYHQRLDRPQGETGTSTIGDLLPDKTITTPDQAATLSDSELELSVGELISSLSNDEKAVLLAMLCAMNISAPELCAAIGRKKSATSQFALKIKERLMTWLQDNNAQSLLDIRFFAMLSATLRAELAKNKPISPAMQDFLASVKNLQDCQLSPDCRG